jgi:hypothetical protein
VTVFPVQVTVVEPVPSIKIDPPILPQLSGGGGGGGSNIRVTATCKNIPNGHMTVKNSLNDTLFDDDIDASGEHTYTSPPIQVNSAITYTVVCTPQFGDPDDDQFKKSVRVRFKTTIIEE